MRVVFVLVVCVCLSGVVYGADGISTSVVAIVTFRNGPDVRSQTPVYALASDGKLYWIKTAETASYFFGQGWVGQVQWWGDSQGQPTAEHAADFAREKGEPITLETTWLKPFKAPPKEAAKRATNGTPLDRSGTAHSHKRTRYSDEDDTEAQLNQQRARANRLQRENDRLAEENRWR